MHNGKCVKKGERMANILTRRSIKTSADIRAEKCLKEIQAVLTTYNCNIIPRIIITGGTIDGSQFVVTPKEYIKNNA